LKRIFDYISHISHYLAHHPWWINLLHWSKTHSLPGLRRIPVYSLLVFIIRELKSDTLTTRANSMAYSFFLAIFPAIIVLFTLLAYTPLYENFDEVLRESIHDVMPGNAGNLLFKTIQNITTIPRSGLLSVGFFLSMWFASNGMLSMMHGLEKDYPSTFKKRKGVEKRLIAIQLTVLVAFVLVASVVFVILGNQLLGLLFRFVKVDLFTRFAAFSFRWIVVLLLFYSTFSTIYRYGSSTLRKISFFNAGAMLATLLSILASWGFSFYVDNFANYNKVYGTIGALIVLMIWIQLNCLILLIGFELNAGIAILQQERYMQRKKSTDP